MLDHYQGDTMTRSLSPLLAVALILFALWLARERSRWIFGV